MENKKSYLNAVFIPILIGLFIIATLSIYSIYDLQSENISQKAYKSLNVVKRNLDIEIAKKVNLYSGLMDVIESDKNIIDAFKSHDRELLYSRTRKIFEIFNQKFEMTHFYFHLPNKEVLLRVHNREVHSDLINRYTLQKAEETNKEVSGLEFGI